MYRVRAGKPLQLQKDSRDRGHHPETTAECTCQQLAGECSSYDSMQRLPRVLTLYAPTENSKGGKQLMIEEEEDDIVCEFFFSSSHNKVEERIKNLSYLHREKKKNLLSLCMCSLVVGAIFGAGKLARRGLSMSYSPFTYVPHARSHVFGLASS